jgi:hypothetical protein
LFSTIAHNGSGPQKASFLKMLLVEDVMAQAQRPFGICLGAATLTLHRFLDLATLTPDQLALPIANFTIFNDIIIADYLLPSIAEHLANTR